MAKFRILKDIIVYCGHMPNAHADLNEPCILKKDQYPNKHCINRTQIKIREEGNVRCFSSMHQEQSRNVSASTDT